jgi:hypothetical protein
MSDEKSFQEALAVSALVSGFEQDLREIIKIYLADYSGNLEGLDGIDLAGRQVETGQSVIEWLYIGEALDIINQRLANLHEELQRDFKQVLNNPENSAAVHRIRKNSGHSREEIAYQEGDFQAIHGVFTLLNSSDFVRTQKRLASISNGSLATVISEIFPANNYCLNNLPPKDYSETSLMGRRMELQQLIEELQSPYLPVISVIAPGGVGKTALALEAAWTLASMRDSFDLVFWHSAKQERWTVNGAIQNEEVETDLFSAFSAFGKVVDPSFEGDVDDLLELIGDSKTLVVFDNFETFTGNDFVELLRKFPRFSKIKILITSRRGIGSNEHKFELKPLAISAAIALLMKYSRVRRVEQIIRLTDAARVNLVEDFLCKPLDIKWLVESIAAGKSITEIRAVKSDLLAYCVQAVMQQLSHVSRAVLGHLVLAKEGLALAELHLLVGTDLVEDLVPAIHELRQSGAISLAINPKDPNIELIFLSEVSSAYLERSSYFSSNDLRALREKRTSVLQQMSRPEAANASLTNPFSVYKRDKEDSSVAIMLQRALRESRNDLEKSLGIIHEARSARRGYFESDRVEAFLVQKRDPERAQALFQKAFDLANEGIQRAIVAYHFGDLLAYLGDLDRALEMSTYANNELHTPHTLQQVGYVMVRSGKFDEGVKVLENAVQQASGRTLVHASTKLAKAFERWADNIAKESHDAEEAMDKIYAGLDVLGSTWLSENFDEKAMSTYCNLVSTGAWLCDSELNFSTERREQVLKSLLYRGDILNACLKGLSVENREVIRLGEKLSSLAISNEVVREKIQGFEFSGLGKSTLEDFERHGQIRNINQDKGYGFVDGFDGQQYYLSKRDVKPKAIWSQLHNGSKISFTIDPESASNIAEGRSPFVSDVRFL